MQVLLITYYGHSQNSLLVENYSLLVGTLAALWETFKIEFKLLGMEHKVASYLPRPTTSTPFFTPLTLCTYTSCGIGHPFPFVPEANAYPSFRSQLRGPLFYEILSFFF